MILAPFDILKEIATVNFEWVEVVREGRTEAISGEPSLDGRC
jgi:hypothetical protein